jgi:hypothetical protein
VTPGSVGSTVSSTEEAITPDNGTLSPSEYFAVSDSRTGTYPYELIAVAGFIPQSYKYHRHCQAMDEPPVGATIVDRQLGVLPEAPAQNRTVFIVPAVSAKTNSTISWLSKTNTSVSAKLETPRIPDTHRTASRIA